MEKLMIGTIDNWWIVHVENPGDIPTFSYEVHGTIGMYDKKGMIEYDIKVQTSKILKMNLTNHTIETQSFKYKLSDNSREDEYIFLHRDSYVERMTKNGVIVIT